MASSLSARANGTHLMHYEAARQAVAKAWKIDEVKAIRAEADARRAAAKVAKDKRLEADAAAIRLRAERRLDQLIEAQRKLIGLAKGGWWDLAGQIWPRKDGPPTPWREAGIDKHLAKQCAQSAGCLDDDTERDAGFEAMRADVAEGGRVGPDIISDKPRGTLGTGENEWYTPQEFL